MTKPHRLAFLGVDHPHGAAWRELLRHFGEEVCISAIVPGFGGAVTSLEETLADVPRYADADELLGRAEFDAAVVCLPNNECPAAAAALAQAGKHILVEKPAAREAADWQPVVEAVRSGGVAFQSGYMWRYDRGAERLQSMFRERRFGRLISVEMTFVTSDVRRRGPDHYLFDRTVSGGGFFNWLACHNLDLLSYITGQTIVGVTARTDVFGATPVDVEDGGAVILDLADGGMATLVGGYWIPRWAGEHHWTLRGSERWVHWRPADGGGVLEIHGPQPQWHAMEETFRMPVDTTQGYGGYRGVELIRDWLDAMQTGAACRNTPASTLATLELLDAIYTASSQGRHVECHIEAA